VIKLKLEIYLIIYSTDKYTFSETVQKFLGFSGAFFKKVLEWGSGQSLGEKVVRA